MNETINYATPSDKSKTLNIYIEINLYDVVVYHFVVVACGNTCGCVGQSVTGDRVGATA